MYLLIIPPYLIGLILTWKIEETFKPPSYHSELFLNSHFPRMKSKMAGIKQSNPCISYPPECNLFFGTMIKNLDIAVQRYHR